VDEITLTMPRERPFYAVVHLVLGGLATRLDLTVETLEDLQLAFDSLLERAPSEEEVTISIRVREGAIEANVGPFDGAALQQALESTRGSVGLGRILRTVADEVDVNEEEQGHWVTLTKLVRAPEASR
jgi:anti-sigma regulatory factor (Ser/Thr protein kinase)